MAKPDKHIIFAQNPTVVSDHILGLQEQTQLSIHYTLHQNQNKKTQYSGHAPQEGERKI